MKKNKIPFIIIIILIVALGVSLMFLVKYKKEIKQYEENISNQQKIEEDKKSKENIKAEEEKKKQDEQNKFLEENVYNNNIPIGLYVSRNGKLELVKDYYCNWDAENVFAVFYAIASNEKTLDYTTISNIFNENWEAQENTKNYKIGYSIKYGLDNGETVDKLILDPTAAESLFSKLQFYLYDDVTYIPGRPYYHLRQYEMTDDTMITSVKIVGDKETPEINGPIELTVFTYDSQDDFDKETGKYLGKSSFTTKIYRERGK